MYRLLFVFGTFILFFAFGYWLQSEFPGARLVPSNKSFPQAQTTGTKVNDSAVDAAEPLSPSLHEVVKQYSGQRKAKEEKKDHVQPVSLEKARGRELFAYLYSEHFRKNFSQKDMEEIRNRFRTPLPRNFVNHVSMEQKEMANRLGILRAMEPLATHQMSAALRSDIGEFYVGILFNEKNHWLNRRQAYLNWKKIRTDRSEEEVKKQLAKIDSQVLSLAALSEAEMIEALFE